MIKLKKKRFQGLEWTSGHPALSLLSWSHANLTGSSPGLVRNELVHTNILTGKVLNTLIIIA